MGLPRASIDAVAPAFALFKLGGSTALYTALGARIPEDPELVEIAAHGLAAYPAVHFLNAVHYLLLRDPHDPLARYYATLTENPASPEEAFPDFASFCKRHREEILHILKTRTVQSTTEERCKMLMPLLSYVADMAGEPLNLIEIGCSAGVLLTFDKYAYELKGRGLLGSKDAPMTLSVDVNGSPDLRIPRIGRRIGLDLHPVDAGSEDERRWLLAHVPPEWRETQARLATALDVVAHTGIDLLEGDALDLLPGVIAGTTGPLCIYHSACICYWNDDAKTALNELLLEKSRGREIFRIEMEFNSRLSRETAFTMDIVVGRYRDGAVDRTVVARADNPTPNDTVLTWLNYF